MADWRVERLGRPHHRSEFRCGKAPLDDFIHTLVSQYEKRNLGRTYVAVRGDDQWVHGYYTLASGAVWFQHLPAGAAKKLPRHPVPVILLARLAVDLSARGQLLGELLLVDALRRTAELAERLGIHAVEVDAIDEEAQAFYLKYGFVPLKDREFHLFMPMTTIRDAFGGDPGKQG